MANFTVPENPEFSLVMRMLERTDPAVADLFNGMFAQLLENDAHIKSNIPAAVAMSYDPGAESLAFSYAGGGIAPGTGASPYVLPVATATTLGGVRIGEGVAVDADGTISVDADGIAESAASLVEENAEEFSIDEISALFNQV